jgi:hypothetical protein
VTRARRNHRDPSPPVGLGLGRLIPSLNDWLDKLRIGTVSLPIAAGLLLMYPVLAKVRYESPGLTRPGDPGAAFALAERAG